MKLLSLPWRWSVKKFHIINFRSRYRVLVVTLITTYITDIHGRQSHGVLFCYNILLGLKGFAVGNYEVSQLNQSKLVQFFYFKWIANYFLVFANHLHSIKFNFTFGCLTFHDATTFLDQYLTNFNTWHLPGIHLLLWHYQQLYTLFIQAFKYSNNIIKCRGRITINGREIKWNNDFD